MKFAITFSSTMICCLLVATQETNLYVTSVTQSEPTVVKFVGYLSRLLILASRFGNNPSMADKEAHTIRMYMYYIFL